MIIKSDLQTLVYSVEILIITSWEFCMGEFKIRGDVRNIGHIMSNELCHKKPYT